MNPGRRLALTLGAGMGLTAVAAQWAKPVPDPRAAGLPTLDRLFPSRFGGWRVDPAAELLVKPTEPRGRVDGIYDQVLERTYVDDRGGRVMLLAAEGSEQSAGLQLHRPEICYPGNGFRVDGLHAVVLQPGGRRLPGTQLHASMPGRSEPITYWVVLGGKAVADSRDFRMRQLQFGLQRRLVDGLLVRLSSIDPQPEHAYALHASFVDALVAALPPAALMRVVGS